ncbi:Lipase maturation factor 1 (Transmembrane protein 112) [Durusdinium trenchii]|uniref:Lipase maturation factor 2 n=1 Tax=Durusdinium trenchii TaxID=1381693 RepID=A0ABP0KY59_9DINO
MAFGPKAGFILCLVLITVWLSYSLNGLIERWNPSPRLTWGLVSRGFGLVYIIVLGSFHPQVVPLCGRRGVTPVAQLLQQAQKDYPGFKKLLYFPTWLWLDASDTALRLTTLSGILGGVLGIYGGTVGWWGLVLARLALQSVAVTGEFWFVWDYMVFEAGALVLLLPETLPLSTGSLGASNLPVPCVALAWQALAIRLMLGFAKTKFSESDVAKDNLFLQGFFIWQLLPNHLAWFLHHAPLWLLRASYGFMLYVEAILPFCCFLSGAPRFVGAWGLIILMLGIFMTGNWGQFNLGYIIVCVGLLDLNISWSMFFAQSWLLPPLMAVYLFIGFICLCLFDTWTNTAWAWFSWELLPIFQLHGLLGLVRFVSPWRLINAYGVFPPEALPQVRSTVVFEGSYDGSTWKMYPYKYQPHKASSPPCTFLAPHHPRLDHRVFYPFEMTSKSDLCSAYCINDHNPYCYTPEGFMQRMQQRLLEGAPEVLSLFAANPFPNKPPAQVRVVIKGVSPTSLEDRKATGNWWYVQELCEVIAPRRLDETVWDRWVPCPEAFHPEHDIWRARAATLEALRTPAPDAATVEAATAGLPEEEVASFWRDFVPEAQKSRGDWPTLWSRSQAIAARFGRKSLAVYERMVGRYVLLLRSSVTNEIIRDVGLDTLMGNWRLHLLFHDAILEGKAAYVETLKSPQSLVERAKRMDDARLLDLIGLLRPDDLRFEDLKFRYVRDLKQRPDRRGFITNVLEMDKGGFYSMLKFLLAQQPLTPLWLPKARLLDSGAWAVEGYEEQKKAPGNPLTEPMLK